jgi:hypothetical protein
MQGLTPSYKLSLISVIVLLLGLTSGDVAHGRKKLVSSSDGEPCHKMTVYYHDIFYDGTNTVNATSGARPSVRASGMRQGLLLLEPVVTTEFSILELACSRPGSLQAYAFHMS